MTDNIIEKGGRTQKTLDCLFVYVGRSGKTEYDLLLMPMGFLALADLLMRNGIATKVLNLYLEKIIDADFSLERAIGRLKPKIVCFSIHWHPQMMDTIKIIRRIKKKYPLLSVVVGGLSASYFFREILLHEKAVDFVIRGDAEIPLVLLANSVLGIRCVRFDDIPNLCWRKNKKIVVNVQSYVVTPEILNSLRYANFDIMYRKDLYLKGIWGWKKGGNSTVLETRKNIFYYSPARGCSFMCSFCGGGREAQKTMHGRNSTIIKSFDHVMADLKMAKKSNINTIYLCADPLMSSEYYEKLFSKIKKSKILFTIYFEHFSIPSEKFIRSFRRTFRKDSTIILSPETGSEYIRRRNKGYYYSNEELVRCLGNLAHNEVATELYFTSGLPFERDEHFLQTVNFIMAIRKKYLFKLYAFPLHLEPLSPMYMNPKKYGVMLQKKTYKDFISRPFDLGYSTKYFSKERILSNINILQRL